MLIRVKFRPRHNQNHVAYPAKNRILRGSGMGEVALNH
jgi:hypothetical protein